MKGTAAVGEEVGVSRAYFAAIPQIGFACLEFLFARGGLEVIGGLDAAASI